MKQMKILGNYVALALCIMSNLTVEQVFEIVSGRPEIIETFKTLRI